MANDDGSLRSNWQAIQYVAVDPRVPGSELNASRILQSRGDVVDMMTVNLARCCPNWLSNKAVVVSGPGAFDS